MIEIKVFPDSPVEGVFAFKCCCIPDQNLEFQLFNKSDRIVRVHSYCDLIKENGDAFRIQHLFPQGVQEVLTTEPRGFYCSFPEELLKQYKEIAFYDIEGNKHSKAL